MARIVDLPIEIPLEEYESLAYLAPALRELESEASHLVPRLEGRTVWMINSTARGGGVAEMLPTMIGLLRQLGVETRWAVLESEEEDFFVLTKRLHNLIHGSGDPRLSEEDRRLYERVCEENALEMLEWLSPGDLVVIHDPQPMAMARFLREHVEGLTIIWRCHIGLDASNESTQAAWAFVEPYAESYQVVVFSVPEYIPEIFPRSSVIYPALDPLTRKNQDLSIHRLVGILSNAALAAPVGPVVTPPYPHMARRVAPDGEIMLPTALDDIGLLGRPIVTQISRWDRLKGFPWVLEAFVKLKRRLQTGDGIDPLHRRRLELTRLVLAGPDPLAVDDDPEGREVFEELVERYTHMEADMQPEVVILALPMSSRAENALMVNAIQRTSSIVVQNSVREGFGLTVTEAMWKRVPVLSNTQACGPRQQIRDGIDGRMVPDPRDSDGLARVLDEMLEQHEERDRWGRNAQRRAYDEFLIFAQIRKWLRLLGEQV